MLDAIIEPSWRHILAEEMKQPYFINLMKVLQHEREAGKLIYPSSENVFRAFELTPFEQVRVLLLGQDPYHGPNQAHGLSFSVPSNIPLPPSLKNIYKELESDLGIEIPSTGDLTHWAQQGVLLLNSALTVEGQRAGSHAKLGWQTFTDAVIRAVSNHHQHVVFLLWGQFAARKKSLIDHSKHCVLTAPHPSPLSYYQGFKGCGHFSATNAYLLAHKKKPIQWG